MKFSEMFNSTLKLVGEIFRLYIQARYVKSTGSLILSAGLAILAITLGFNIVGILTVHLGGLNFAASVTSSETPAFLIYLATLLIILGASVLLYNEHKKHKQMELENNRKVILVVQIDAYSNVTPTPLKASIPKEIIGKATPIYIDKREALLGGRNLQEVSMDIINIEQTLAQYARGNDAADISICAGGLAPVPLLFLLGNVLEDERPIHWAEWERVESRWAWSNEGKQISPWQLSKLESMDAEEVVLKSGISYPILQGDISIAFPRHQVLTWEPREKLFQIIINEQSCINICNEFKSLMLQLKGQGIKRIHLLLACSSALTMRLGSVLDPRNMPEVIVYQYEKNSELIYTWGLGVKVHEGKKTVIVVDRRNTKV